MTTTAISTITNNQETRAVAEWEIINEDIAPVAGWQVLNEDVGGKHSFL